MKSLAAHEHAAGRPWEDWQELARHLVTEHGTGPLAGHLPVAYYVREHAIEHHAIALYEAHRATDEEARPWWTRPEDERKPWLRMARDEMLQEESAEHEVLGRELYERRRPDGGPWDELDKDTREQWVLIAIDHANARRERASEALAAAREETGLTSHGLDPEDVAAGMSMPTSGTTATVAAQVRAVDTSRDLADVNIRWIASMQAAMRVLWPDRPKVYFREGQGEDAPVLSDDERQQLIRVAQALDEPRLGLATNRELIAELSTRIEVHGPGLDYRTVGN